MQRDAAGGASLIAGAIMGLVTMALHPTGSDIARDASTQGALSMAVHALALAAVPILLYGLWVLTRRLSNEGGVLPELALSFYGVAAVATILAATVSGFLSTDIITRMVSLTGEERDVAGALLHYSFEINQAFARVYAAASSIAIALWSLTILRQSGMSRAAGYVGMTVATLALVAVLSGKLRLGIHGFGAVILAQALWLIMVGVQLRHVPAAAPTS